MYTNGGKKSVFLWWRYNEPNVHAPYYRHLAIWRFLHYIYIGRGQKKIFDDLDRATSIVHVNIYLYIDFLLFRFDKPEEVTSGPTF